MSKMSDIDIEIKELNATIEAQDKIIRFVTRCSRAKSAELHELKTKLRDSGVVV